MATFCERLKELRKKHSLTQEQVGQQINVSRYAILLYEKGASCPETKGLIGLADYFNVSSDYLVGRTDKPEVNRCPPFGPLGHLPRKGGGIGSPFTGELSPPQAATEGGVPSQHTQLSRKELILWQRYSPAPCPALWNFSLPGRPSSTAWPTH